MEHGDLLGRLIYEKRTFNYDVGNKTLAKIEVLDFLDGSYASQAIILKTQKQVAIENTTDELIEALKAIYPIIENEIKDDEWVKSVQASELKANRF